MTSGHFEHEVNDSRAVVADFWCVDVEHRAQIGGILKFHFPCNNIRSGARGTLGPTLYQWFFVLNLKSASRLDQTRFDWHLIAGAILGCLLEKFTNCDWLLRSPVGFSDCALKCQSAVSEMEPFSSYLDSMLFLLIAFWLSEKSSFQLMTETKTDSSTLLPMRNAGIICDFEGLNWQCYLLFAIFQRWYFAITEFHVLVSTLSPWCCTD